MPSSISCRINWSHSNLYFSKNPSLVLYFFILGVNSPKKYEELNLKLHELEKISIEQQEQYQSKVEQLERKKTNVECEMQKQLETAHKEYQILQAKLYDLEEMEMLLNEADRMKEHHILSVEQIQKHYLEEITAIIVELNAVNKDLSGVSEGLEQLNILKFSESKKMKAKQLLLVQKQAQLIAMLLNIQLEYSSQLDDEVSNYNESISTIHMKIE